MKLKSVHHVSVPKQGEIVNGDGVVVREEGSTLLLSVIDALGHGPRAAEVARITHDVLTTCPLDGNVLSVIDRIDQSLRGTRGASVLVCVVKGDAIEGCSVGNVELRSEGVRLPFMLTPGVLGLRLRKARTFAGTIDRRTRFAMFSDGLSAKFHLDQFAEFSTKDACHAIFERHRRSHDDATLLLADFDA